MKQLKSNLSVHLLVLGLVVSNLGFSRSFDITQMPKGSSVTLPRPAATLVPISSSIRLSSTDMPQSLKISPVYSGNGNFPIVKIEIFDPSDSKESKSVEIAPNSSVIYPFKSLRTIRVVSGVKNGRGKRKASLRIESNKPLGVGW